MRFLDGTDDSGSGAKAADGKPETNPVPEQNVEDKGSERKLSYEELESAHAELKSKIGKQGAVMGDLKERAETAEEKAKHALAWLDSFEKDPEALIKQTASKLGLEVNAPKAPDFSELLGANAEPLPQDINKLVEAKVNEAMKQNNVAFKNAADAIVEERLVTKYPTYENDKQLRRMVTDRIATGDIPIQEVAQVLVEHGRQAKMISQAKEDAVEEYKSNLAKKNQEMIEGSGRGERESAKELSHFESAKLLPRA